MIVMPFPKNNIFFKIKALMYSQPKGACPAHDPPKYCHAPPATRIWDHGLIR